MDRVRVLDSHTAGEPTRVILAGGPDLGTGPLTDRRDRLRSEFPAFRGMIAEPRGADATVGVALVEPHEPGCVAGAVFFNTVGPLGMCGHATLGLAVSLAHLGRLTPGRYQLDTPVGVVGFDYHGGPRVSLENVPSYRHAAGVRVVVEGVGPVTGDVAWGGNWFFHTRPPHATSIMPPNVSVLSAYCRKVRAALAKAGVTGADGAEIDHVELSHGLNDDRPNHSVNFVLCPGGAFDRSPCGTGTSAKLACLAADGKLRPGAEWTQQSITGSRFTARYRHADGGRVIPTISGEAFVTAEAELLFDPADPLRAGATA